MNRKRRPPAQAPAPGEIATVGLRPPLAWLAIALGLLLLALGSTPSAAQTGEGEAWVLPVNGIITQGTGLYIQRNLDAAAAAGAEVVIVRLNTPGGLVGTTLDIGQAIAASDVPVAVFVGPENAIAASAGAFILVASHVAAMAPGTTVGAAMPVTMDPAQGGSAQPADEKTVTFLTEHIREMARERGRNADVAGRFVTENLTLGSAEAVEQGIAEFRVRSEAELLAAADGHTITIRGSERTLTTAGLALVVQEPSFRDGLQNILSNPQLAFILLMVGIYGLYFGLSAPGTIVPEVLGTVCLVLGIYGLGLFSTNVAGIVLIVIGIAFLIAEVFTPTYGILGAAGALSLILGALLLPQEPWLPTEWFTGFRNMAVATVVTLTGFTFVALAGVVQARARRRAGGAPHQGSGRARVVERLDPEGMVRYEGELWRAAVDATAGPVEPGAEVVVVAREGLQLRVRPQESPEV